MRPILKLILPLLLAVLGTWALAAPVRAASGVQDGANFFSQDTITKADDLIRQIRSTYSRDVLVVTYDGLPADRQGQLNSMGKPRFFATWAQDVGREKGVSGIVILMTRNPGHLEVSVGSKTQLHAFTLADRDELSQQMLAQLRKKQYDGALLDGLQFIKSRMRAGGPSESAAQSSPGASSASSKSSVGGLVCLGVAILIVVFIIMGIANRRRNYGGGYGAPPPGGYPPGYSGGGYPQQGGAYYGGGGGGGGFGRGLLGGLLGGALGAWGYDRFSQGSHYPNPSQPGPTGAGGDFGASSDQTDTSFSGTGGDFGNDSSSSSTGADFGSSDPGGGGFDSGGFDSGGGGDFSGGGDSGSSSGGDF